MYFCQENSSQDENCDLEKAGSKEIEIKTPQKAQKGDFYPKSMLKVACTPSLSTVSEECLHRGEKIRYFTNFVLIYRTRSCKPAPGWLS